MARFPLAPETIAVLLSVPVLDDPDIELLPEVRQDVIEPLTKSLGAPIGPREVVGLGNLRQLRV